MDVTSAANDKGVDVEGDIELGISMVHEKSFRSSVTRVLSACQFLDQLRGSLHRFDAVRGTIVTTSANSLKPQQAAAFDKGVSADYLD